MNEWKPVKPSIVPNIPVLVYIHNKGDYYMCVAEYDPKDDLFYAIPAPTDTRFVKKVYPDAWMELPFYPGLPPK